MRMGSPGHRFSGALADALGAPALREGAVIEEEAEQVQIILAQLPAEEEVIPEAAVEVLDEGTATRGSLRAVMTATSTPWKRRPSGRFRRSRRCQ